VLRLVRGPRHGLDDQVRLQLLDHMPLIAGERARASFAPMAHLRIAEGRLTAFGDTTEETPTSGRPIDRGSRSCVNTARYAVSACCRAGTAWVVRGCAAPRSMRSTVRQQTVEGRRLGRRVVPIDIGRGLQDGALDQGQSDLGEHVTTCAPQKPKSAETSARSCTFKLIFRSLLTCGCGQGEPRTRSKRIGEGLRQPGQNSDLTRGASAAGAPTRNLRPIWVQ
jgi:hypothetical protein